MFHPHRTPCTESVYDYARIFLTRRTPCMYSDHDRARRFLPHRTPCNKSAHDCARIFVTHRTACMICADDRARRLMHHRTPCTDSADDRADKHRTPCSSSVASPRARTARSASGLSSASCQVSFSLDVSVFSASPTSGTSVLTFGLETVVIPPREVGAPLEVADGD